MLLNNPKWQRQYLLYVKQLAELMQWSNIGPHVEQHRDLIKKEVALDTRKLFTTDAFKAATSSANPGKDSTRFRAFVDKRAAFVLNHEKIKALR